MSENLYNKSMESTVEMNGLKKMILAIQHLIAMFGATVLVPILTGLDTSVALVCAGVGTLMFHMVTKRKVPVFLGSSFAFIAVINSVKEMHHGDLTYAQGGIMAAGLLYVLFSFIIKKIGMKKIEKFLPPQVVGPMIMVIGMNLLPTAYGMAKGNYLVSLVTLMIALIITFKAKGFIKQLAILIGVLGGYLLSLQQGIVDTTLIQSSAYFQVPHFTLPKFDLGAIIIIAPIVLAVFMEHIGDITTNGQVVGQDFIEDPGLNRTLLGDGLATLFAGMIGGPANTTYGENTGVLAITKNYNPAILRLAAVCAICIGFIAKIGAFLKTIPTPVMGGISLMLFSMISLIGVKTIKNSQVAFNVKNMIVMITILLIGLFGGMIEHYLGIPMGIPITSTVQITGLSFAAIIGVILNAGLNGIK